MTIDMFMKQCEEAFGGKEYTLGQKAAIIEKCSRFDERQLNRIYSDLLETCKYLPKIADIYESAGSMGMLEQPSPKPHRWKPSDCGLCHGEGRLCIIWHCEVQERGDDAVEVQELVQVFQYSKSFDYKLKPNETRSVFRCKCLAGDVETLPKSWPRWMRESNPRREIWI